MYYFTLFAFKFSSLNQNNGLQSTLCPALTIIKTQSPLEITARARRFYIPLRPLLFTFPQTIEEQIYLREGEHIFRACYCIFSFVRRA